MNGTPLPGAEPPAQSPTDRWRAQPTRSELRDAFWRMLALVRPHRRMMSLGILLGFGVALTYATSLAGILPVLSVVVEDRSLHDALLERAATAHEAGKWYAGTLEWTAQWFPQANSSNSRMTTLMLLLAVLLSINILGNICRVLSQYAVLNASQRMIMDLRRKMYRKALFVPMTTVNEELSSVISQFLSDVREVFLGVVTLFGKVAREPLKAVAVLCVAFVLDAKLTLVALGIAPPAVGLLWYFGRRVRKATVRLLEGYGLMLGTLEETLQGISAVKSYNRENHERRRMWQLERSMLKHQLKLFWIEAISSPLIEVVGILAASCGIVWLAGRVFVGELEASRFLLMVGLLAAMLDPIRKIANVYNMVQRSSAGAHRIFRFLDTAEEHRGVSRELVPAGTNGEPVATGPTAPLVEFDALRFRYHPEGQRVLDDVSFVAQPGECIAIVGPNGSGKSTLLRLLPRLLELQQGTIRIDGEDVRKMSLRALRGQIAIVDQRPVIFARSVRENLRYGDLDATEARIRQAVEQAHADFVDRLPQGYDTRVGEFGTTLSGGQRQRLSIARAFLKPASIVIFDEATSEIDAESERKIHEALDELRRGRTTFLIAHRHTVMDMADRIVVMDAGRIVDIGTQAELLERCPLFVALYRSPAATV